MKTATYRVLLGCWISVFLLALASFGIVAQGLIRDTGAGDPVIRFDPAIRSQWLSASFRVWGSSAYGLHLSSVNHEPARVGRLFGGVLEVSVTAPDGGTVFHKAYPAGSTGHRVPDNYGDVTLDTLALDGWPLRRWQLRLRVLEADAGFRTARTQLRLRKQRYDPGMGGLMNYAMTLPAGIMMLLSLFLSLPLARAGTRWPLLATLAAGIGGLLFVF